MECIQCRSELQEGVEFCSQCGVSQEETDTTSESRLLKMVQAAAITPADAKKIVDQYKSQSKQRYPNDTEWRHQERVADKIISRYSRVSAMAGGATALTGVVPGLGTIVAATGGAAVDAAVSMKLQIDMCMCLLEAFDYDLTSEDARHLAFLIAATGTLQKAGVEAGVRLGSQAGVRMLRQYLKGAALQTVKILFKRVGITFVRKSIEKAIPFGIGVAIGSSANYGLTKYVGKQAKKWFVIDRSMHDEGNLVEQT